MENKEIIYYRESNIPYLGSLIVLLISIYFKLFWIVSILAVSNLLVAYILNSTRPKKEIERLKHEK
jgi:hypothetical protein